jgi:hypothetical protein
MATTFHSERYTSILERDQSNLVRETIASAFFTEAALPPPSHIHLRLKPIAQLVSLLA